MLGRDNEKVEMWSSSILNHYSHNGEQLKKVYKDKQLKLLNQEDKKVFK